MEIYFLLRENPRKDASQCSFYFLNFTFCVVTLDGTFATFSMQIVLIFLFFLRCVERAKHKREKVQLIISRS